MRKKVLILVGTRPNFIKITQFKKAAINVSNLEIKIIHTGQHFDTNMAEVFFEQFNLKPDIFLNIQSGSPNSMIAEIMMKLEPIFHLEKPELLIVVGDVNSTLAGAITANKMNIKLAHLESGLRSNDRTMPEEFNRIVADNLADYFFVTETSGLNNLIVEGKSKQDIFFVGNTMIDTIVAFESQIQKSRILDELEISSGEFILMTMHRPATVDNQEGLIKLFNLIKLISKNHKVVFPMHPRTKLKLEKYNLLSNFELVSNLMLTKPLDYFSFQKLISACKFIITDSGGIQEESTFRLKPCLTLRPNTERPSTIEVGTNTLVPFDEKIISNYIKEIEMCKYKSGTIPDLWDGKSTERIINILSDLLQ